MKINLELQNDYWPHAVERAIGQTAESDEKLSNLAKSRKLKHELEKIMTRYALFSCSSSVFREFLDLDFQNHLLENRYQFSAIHSWFLFTIMQREPVIIISERRMRAR